MEITSFERNRSYTVTHYKRGVLGRGVRIDTIFAFEPVSARSVPLIGRPILHRNQRCVGRYFLAIK